MLFFFFSSRRRHTRCSRDWSSDVCSSDLAERAAKLASPNDYLVLDTLAAAHASAGHFDQACDFQQQALACAPPKIASSLKQRLALYRKGHAYRNVGAPDG